MEERVLLSLHVLFSAPLRHIHTWELPTASRWTGRLLLRIMFVCVLIGWLGSWGRRAGCGLEKQLRRDEPWSHLQLFSQTHTHMYTHTQTHPGDIKYSLQLREDLDEHLSFFLISPLLCPPFHFLLLSLPSPYTVITSTLSSWLFPLSFYSWLILDETAPLKINLLTLTLSTPFILISFSMLSFRMHTPPSELVISNETRLILISALTEILLCHVVPLLNWLVENVHISLQLLSLHVYQRSPKHTHTASHPPLGSWKDRSVNLQGLVTVIGALI